ncbi:MAG: 2-C-methyl-D-erythritol 2,4-cyclodiphosphate synthase [bacterium]
MKVGIGFDIHPFATGRPFYLGGVRIDFEKGLAGHSDGDALLHSVIDAVLGAAGQGDKGKHFPDTDPKYKNISSVKLLEKTMSIAKVKVVNADCIVLCGRPRLSKYYNRMRSVLAKALNIKKGSVSIKATRPEGIGIDNEGIACFCACLIE